MQAILCYGAAMTMTVPACRLYIVSPPRFTLAEFLPRVKDAFAGGDVAAFQLRLKEAEDAEILRAAEALLPLCREKNAAFILNDRPDLAKQCGADGVHLGQDDLTPWPLKKTRDLLREESVIGVSCHASKHLAMVAGEETADYVAFGAFYPTRSKPQEKVDKWGTPGTDILSWWQEVAELPCVAIGGITPENCGLLVRAGADFIAAITSVWEHKEGPCAAVAAFNRAIARSLAAKQDVA